jgi:hypothetical protein
MSIKSFFPLAVFAIAAIPARGAASHMIPAAPRAICTGLTTGPDVRASGTSQRGGGLEVATLEMPASLASAIPSSCYPPLSFATPGVPAGTAGSKYSASLTANGGQPPYSWAFGQSALPPGFSISPNGTISGTPQQAGTYPFHVIVSDSLKNNVLASLVLTVNPADPTSPPPPTNPPPTNPPPTNPPPTNPPPTNPPPTNPPLPGPPPSGKALTACKDLTSGGHYYLANDVSSPGTCFGIDADGISLNLNGHTITYGTGGGTTPTPAIEGHDCWFVTGHFIGGPCGSRHGGVEVYNGTIIQSPNSASFSDAFSFGQGTFSSAPYIHDITATIQNQGAQFYYSTFMVPGARIENNNITDNVTNIQLPGQGMLSARSAFQGQTIAILGPENNPGTGDTITGNTIVGGPQGGIRSVNQNTTISNNDISMNSNYSNDYCFEVSAAGTKVTNNNCHPISGRGINIDAGNVTVTNNTFNVTELMQNLEYGHNGQPGCEGGGAYGIRFKYIPYNSSFSLNNDLISNNNVVVTAGPCQAVGVQFVLTPVNASITVMDNTVTTVNLNQGQQDYSIGSLAAHGDGISVTGNTFRSTTGYVSGEWDGYNNFTIGHNTWAGSPQYTVAAQDGACDPSVSDSLAVCPASVTVTDPLPDTVQCGPYSMAKVTIAGHTTQCTAKQ